MEKIWVTREFALEHKKHLEEQGRKATIERIMVPAQKNTYSNRRDAYGQLIRNEDGTLPLVRKTLVLATHYKVKW